MNKTVAIVQSNYIPWKGYFDLINMADEFILYDDVQYTKNDWRNRNLIKTSQGVQWITIPVHGGLDKLIKDVEVTNHYWSIKHWKTLITNYSKASYFNKYKHLFSDLYAECYTFNNLSEINYKFIKIICDILNIGTKLTKSMDYAVNLNAITDKTTRVVTLCKSAKATRYISGPAGRNYINEEHFKQEGIEIAYIDYAGYPLYKQLFGKFTHTVSIIDLVFNEGPNAIKYLRSFT